MGFLHYVVCVCVYLCMCVCVCVCGSNSGNYKLTVVERVEDKNRDHVFRLGFARGLLLVVGNGMIIIRLRIRKSSSSYLVYP